MMFSTSEAAQKAARSVVLAAQQADLLPSTIAIAPELAEAEKQLLTQMLGELRHHAAFSLDEISSLFTFVTAKAAEAATDFLNGKEIKFELAGMLDGKAPIYAAEHLTGHLKTIDFGRICAQGYIDWFESGDKLDHYDPRLLLFEALKWTFRLTCALSVDFLQKK